MKSVFVALALCFVVPLAPIACKTPPSARVVQTQTLLAVGHTAEAAVTLAAQLYASGQITAPQVRQVIDYFDTKFQPVFRVAKAAVNADMSSLASPELAGLAAQLSALVASFVKQPSSPPPL